MSTHIYTPIIVFGVNALSKFIVILIFQYILYQIITKLT